MEILSDEDQVKEFDFEQIFSSSSKKTFILSPKIGRSSFNWCKEINEVAIASMLDALDQELIVSFVKEMAEISKRAKSMAYPVKRRLDHQSFARKAFMVESIPLSDAALPYFEGEDE